MSEQFKVGDICIGWGMVVETDRNGLECEIIGGLRLRAWRRPRTGETGVDMCYRVRWADGLVTGVSPERLRRKRPPKPARDIDAKV